MYLKSLLLLIVLFIDKVYAFDSKDFGFYAFEKSKSNQIPPRVRKPPYIQSNIPCPGVLNPSLQYLTNKENLCGDLNRGYVPLNPMNIIIQNQYYPFELIKNKTLLFLAKSLPYLKEDIDNIPKVFKVPQNLTSPQIVNNNLADYNYYGSTDTFYKNSQPRFKREVKPNLGKLDKSDSNETNVITNNHNFTSGSSKKLKNLDKDTKINFTESRQKICESDGIFCQLMQLMTANSKSNNNGGSFSNGILNTISQTIQAMNTAESISNIAQILTGPLNDNYEKTGSESNSKPLISHVISAINTLSNSGSSSSSNSALNNNTLNSYNPIGAIIDYFTSSSITPSIPNLISKRKKPVDFVEDLFSSMSSSLVSTTSTSPNAGKNAAISDETVQVTQSTPNPCPSIEEYVAPVYAQNYQGIWKYVVQIPHEGYFTQTVQKTSCVKNKCNFLEGFCKESSRWVSLLVAEVYYPNSKQAIGNMLPTTQASYLKSNLMTLSNGNNVAGVTDLNQLNQHHPYKVNTLMSNINNINNNNNNNNNNNAHYLNYELFNNLVPNQNEYNRYDQLFSRRVSNNNLSPQIATIQNTPAQNGLMQQNQNSFFHNTLNQFINSKFSNKNNAAMQTQSRAAQLQYLVDLYQHQLYKQQQHQKQQQMLYHNAQLQNKPLLKVDTPLKHQISPISVANLVTSASMMNSIHHHKNGIHEPKHNVKPRSLDSTNTRNNVEPNFNLNKNNYNNYLDEEENLTPVSSFSSVINNNENETNNSSTNINKKETSNLNKNNQPETTSNEDECDGYDNNGCYIIRVYYDWFLVPGSCKCWKKQSSGGSFDTLKKIFIGK